MKHLDTGTIQAFLDGELADHLLEAATAHLAVCDCCTAALVEAEHETAALDFAFAAEKSLGVPTQRIWARLENEIEVLNRCDAKRQPQKTSLWHNVAAFLPFGETFNFTQSQIAFAGSLAAIVLFSLVGVHVLQRESAVNQVVSQNSGFETQLPAPARNSIDTTEINVDVERTPIETIENSVVIARKPVRIAGYEFSKAVYEPVAKKAKSEIRNPKSEIQSVPLTEEQTYLTAINDLKKAVESSDAAVMRPSFRVEYEQNMAMTDQAIAKMQARARRDPQDENAKRVLFRSYQNKIDLLNTVAEKSQLMASLR